MSDIVEAGNLRIVAMKLAVEALAAGYGHDLTETADQIYDWLTRKEN